MGLFDSFGGDRPWYAQDDGMLPINLLRALYSRNDNSGGAALGDPYAAGVPGMALPQKVSQPDAPGFAGALRAAAPGPVMPVDAQPTPGGPAYSQPTPGLPAWAGVPSGGVGNVPFDASNPLGKPSEDQKERAKKVLREAQEGALLALDPNNDTRFGPSPGRPESVFNTGSGTSVFGANPVFNPTPPPAPPMTPAPGIPQGFQPPAPAPQPPAPAPQPPTPAWAQVQGPLGPPAAPTPPQAAAAPPPAAPDRTAQAYGGGAGAPPAAPGQDVYQALGQTGAGGGFNGAMRGLVANFGLNPFAMIGGALGGAMGMGEQQQELAARQATFQAARGEFMRQGLDANEASSRAMLVAMNPVAAQAAMPELMGNRYEKTVLNRPDGSQQIVYTDKFNPGRMYTPQQAGANSGVNNGGYAPGVNDIDSSLTGDAYLKQYSPEVQASVHALIHGDEMPPSARNSKGIAQLAHTAALKYAADMKIPYTDNLYQEKRRMYTKLADSSNSSMGGILANGDSSFEHLADASGSMVAAGNSSHNFPGGAHVAHAQNFLRNQVFPGSDREGLIGAIDQNLGRYGQESTKFYSATGGSEGERMDAKRAHSAALSSSGEQAAFLEKERDLMVARLNGQFRQILDVLGPEDGQREIAKRMPNIEKNMKTLNDNIARLRGEEPGPDNTGPPQTVIQNGHTFTRQSNGTYKYAGTNK